MLKNKICSPTTIEQPAEIGIIDNLILRYKLKCEKIELFFSLSSYIQEKLFKPTKRHLSCHSPNFWYTLSSLF